MKYLLILLSLLILAACAPAPNETLPTLARFPTETESAPIVVVDLTEAAQLRTPLPATFTPTASATPLPPSVTVSITPTVTITPSATITDTPTRTPTNLPTIDPNERPLLAFALTAYAMTVLPPDYQVPPHQGVNVTLIPTQPVLATPNNSGIVVIGGQPTATLSSNPNSNCSTLPAGGFLTVYNSHSDIPALLGCATGNPQSIPAASQNFQQGMMFWLNGEIIALYSQTNLYQSYADTFVQGVDPENSSETPPSGLFTPIRGFLKVWSGTSAVRNGLAWATGTELGATATVQTFTNGRMVYLAGRSDVIILIGAQSGQWLSFVGQY